MSMGPFYELRMQNCKTCWKRFLFHVAAYPSDPGLWPLTCLEHTLVNSALPLLCHSSHSASSLKHERSALYSNIFTPFPCLLYGPIKVGFLSAFTQVVTCTAPVKDIWTFKGQGLLIYSLISPQHISQSFDINVRKGQLCCNRLGARKFLDIFWFASL